MRLSLLFFIGLLASTVISNAQAPYRFTSGLVITDCHRYGREAIVIDEIAYQLNNGQLKKPEAGGTLFTNEKGENVSWKKIEVDSTAKFRGGLLGNGYIYLSYQSEKAQNAILNINGDAMFYFNGEPRGGDIYGDGWMKSPVKLKAGLNEILIRCGQFSRWQGVGAQLIFDQKPIFISVDDVTLPHVVLGESQEKLLGAVVLINQTEKALTNLTITTTLNGKSVESNVLSINPYSMFKSPFAIDASATTAKGDHICSIVLKQKGKVIDTQSLTITAVNADEHHTYTFVSDVDGSVQYYSVAPQSKNTSSRALFLSVHGAGVQAIGQARAYQPKDWGTLVAPTNRRPRGFNWEDWGRIDALEVLALATKRYQPDPEKIYLTGHSMGGHGTWYLGATYPEKWAAIAPCAGYPTLTGYGSADGKIPDKGRSPVEETLLRASNASNVIALAKNYGDLGIYIHHGDSDKVVSVDYARQMKKILADFHKDFSYYEYPGGSHWFGNESVDWAPIFEYFKWHKVKQDSAAEILNFITANPAISSHHHWASILQQNKALEYSAIRLQRNKKAHMIKGSTENVATLRLSLEAFNPGETISLTIDSVKIDYVVSNTREVFLSGYPQWKVGVKPDARQKNEIRSGTFKEAFNHKMVFVYGTNGTAQENAWAFNKVRYDAEVWYYRGNGMVEIVADKNFSPEKFKDRGVVLYGNSYTNTAWNKLLKGCPINIAKDRVTVGKKTYEGTDLAAYFTWPRQDSESAMVAVIGGTGLQGMSATDANQYFAAGAGFADYMVFSNEMLKAGAKGIRTAGFYSNKWELID